MPFRVALQPSTLSGRRLSKAVALSFDFGKTMAAQTLKTLGNVLFGLLGIAMVGLIAGLTILPQVLHYGTYVVLSGSMEPAIRTGSVIVAAATPQDQLKVGDVITYVRAGDQENVTHRIVDIKSTPDGLSFVTKGDANSAPDADEIRYTSTAGKVVATVPYAGYFFKAIGSPVARFIFIVVPGTLLVGMWLWEIWRPKTDVSRKETEVPPNMSPGPTPEPASQTSAETLSLREPAADVAGVQLRN
jgi:signal peptidase I